MNQLFKQSNKSVPVCGQGYVGIHCAILRLSKLCEIFGTVVSQWNVETVKKKNSTFWG